MMKPRNPHGVAPERAETVLLLVDGINDFDFPEGDKLLRFALPAARRIAALKKRLRKRGVLAIYVNDNFGRWQSDFKKQVERCVNEDAAGAEVARLLIPAEDDYFVLKPNVHRRASAPAEASDTTGRDGSRDPAPVSANPAHTPRARVPIEL
ncbi:MAG: isochorismatase family protein [Chthoniobacteraceae bacterium]